MTSLTKKAFKSIALIIALIALTACGGGGGGGSSTPDLVAAFSVDDAEPKKTQVVSFDASSSTGSISTYSWNFGDGGTGTGQTAEHTYTSDGLVTVTLTLADSKGATVTKTTNVTVSGQLTEPAAQFSVSTLKANGEATFDGSLSNDSDGNIVSYEWDFGDGDSSTGAIATHTYQNEGSVTATLTITDDDGLTNTATQNLTVGPVNVAPTASFEYTTLPNLQVFLNASDSADSDGTITGYTWTIVDSNGTHEETGETVTHTFATAGSYDVTLTLTDNNGATSNSTVTVIATNTVAQILTIGDSITHGDSGHGSYRYELWKKLVDADIADPTKSFDFIGTETSNFGGNYNYPDYQGRQFDRDHQAAWGQTADYFLVSGRLDTWIQSYDPDIAIIHIGTNDVILQGDTTGAAAEDIKSIIGILRGKNPNVKVLLAKIIPVSTENNEVDAGEAAHIDTLNTAIEAMAATETSVDSPIVIVDQNTGFNPAIGADTHDGVHPNSGGEAVMATKWYDEMTTNSFF